MIQRRNLFLLLTALLFASCDCNNSDTDNGPRDEEKKPNFIFSLGEGLKKGDLSANRPIPLVLKDENFSKHNITEYKYPNQKAEKGSLHFMDVNGKPGKRVESSDTIELKDGVFPLVFVPNGKSGQDTISLEVSWGCKQSASWINRANILGDCFYIMP